MQPLRDGEEDDVARWLRDTLKLIVNRLDVVRMDVLNERIQAIRHIMAHHGIEYERRSFERRLAAGEVKLERTEAHIQSTVKLLADAGKLRAVQLLQREDYENVLVDVAMRLVSIAPPEKTNLPETLALDRVAMESLNAHFLSEVLCLSILATLQSFAPEQLMERVAAKLLRDAPVPGHARSVDACLSAVGEEIAHLDDAAIIRGMLAKHADPGHSVFRCLVSAPPNERCFQTTDAHPCCRRATSCGSAGPRSSAAGWVAAAAASRRARAPGDPSRRSLQRSSGAWSSAPSTGQATLPPSSG